MVPFAGYELPVQYVGVIAEARAVRSDAGMFDVSHMARLRFRGEGLLEFLERITANDVSKLTDGVGQYSLLPNERGGTVDDIIVYRIHETEFRMVVNAANHAKDVAWMKSQMPGSITLEDETEFTAMIAVQGPHAAAKIEAMCGQPGLLEAIPMFGTIELKVNGFDVFAARSGYTGEDGFELICSNANANALWNALLEAGVQPCGLGSRDVLRVEAGLPLYGHELSDDTSPLDAGLGWVISKSKEFIGSADINAVRTAGPSKKLQGIRMASKRIPAVESRVLVGSQDVGFVSSSVFSPLLDCGIAFAFLDPSVEIGTEIGIDFRGKVETGRVVQKRFFKREKQS